MPSPPVFPPPRMDDPDAVGWPMCTAAAMWRQGRFQESLDLIAEATAAAFQAANRARVAELRSAHETLSKYVERWQNGDRDADPQSVPLSIEYPSIEVIEEYVAEEWLHETTNEGERFVAPAIAQTLPSGIFGEGARPLPKLSKLYAKRAAREPLVLDFEGSILAKKPE